MMYLAYQAQSDMMEPVRSMARLAASALRQPVPGFPGLSIPGMPNWADSFFARNLSAACEVIGQSKSVIGKLTDGNERPESFWRQGFLGNRQRTEQEKHLDGNAMRCIGQIKHELHFVTYGPEPTWFCDIGFEQRADFFTNGSWGCLGITIFDLQHGFASRKATRSVE